MILFKLYSYSIQSYLSITLFQEAAAEAKRKGQFLGRGLQPMVILWSRYQSPKTKSTPSTSSVDAGPSRSRKRLSDGIVVFKHILSFFFIKQCILFTPNTCLRFCLIKVIGTEIRILTW